MDILKSSYYIRCNKYLSFCGHWPYQKPRVRIVNQCLLLLAISTVFLPQSAKMFEVRHNLHHFLLCIPSMMFYGQFIFKNFFAFIQRKEIKQVLEKIRHDFQSHKGEELKILYKFSKGAYQINTLYTVYMYLAAIMYSGLPFTLHIMDIVKPINETRLPYKPRLIKYFVNEFDENIFFIIFHGLVVDLMTMIFIIGFDTLYCSFAYHVCSLFVIVTKKLQDFNDIEKASGKNKLSETFRKDEDIYYNYFVEAVIMHQHVLEFVKILEEAFSALNLLSIGCAMLPLTITGFEVLLNKANFLEMCRYILFAMGELAHIFYYNWPGQKIRDHSLLVYQSCYNCKWYNKNISDKSKKLLNFMIVRSQKPSYLTAKGLYILGLENFATVLKACMSYFTVLSSMM